MPRPKKDGHHINLYITRVLFERLKAYSEAHNETMTVSLERILESFFQNDADSIN